MAKDYPIYCQTCGRRINVSTASYKENVCSKHCHDVGFHCYARSITGKDTTPEQVDRMLAHDGTDFTNLLGDE